MAIAEVGGLLGLAFVVGCLVGIASGIRIMKRLVGKRPDRLYLDREIRRVAAIETASALKP